VVVLVLNELDRAFVFLGRAGGCCLCDVLCSALL